MKKLNCFLAITGLLSVINYATLAQGYCPPTITCTSAAITSVNLNGTTNTSGTVGGYTSYASPTFTVSQAGGYTLTVDGTINFAGTYLLNAWIDYDGSGDWNGVISERVEIAPPQAYALGNFTKSVSFAVPATATIGASRLRLQLRFIVGGGAPNPCQTGFCGEVEDYPLTIAALPPLCSSASNNSSSIYISRTDINGTTNFSGPSTSSSFPGTITLFPQTTYFAIVDITNPTNVAQSVYVYGWLDVDGNKVYSTSGSEQIVLTPIAVTVPALGSITVNKGFNFTSPFAAQATTMRITASLAASGVPTPCQTSFTGEVEDYAIILHADYCANGADPTTIGTSSIVFNGNTYPIACCNNYVDNTSTVIPIVPGQSYPFSQITYGGITVAAVYIDYNQNGIFSDPGEAVTLTGPVTFSGTVSVPLNATVGNTRMRVVSRFTVGGGLPADCGLNGVFGTVADYTVSTIALGPPTISCSGNVTVFQDPGVCSAQVIYSTPICTANCNGGTISLISGLPSGSVFPLGTTQVHYRLTTFGGTDDCFFNVTVNMSPTPVISPASSSICQGSSIGLNSFSSYQWNTGATSQSIIPTNSGTYTATVTNSSGCTGTVSKTVTVNALPNPVITGATSFCSGGSTTLNAGAGYSLYNWSTGATTQTINVNTATTVTVTVTDGNGCTGSDSKTTTVNANPTPSITGSTSFCSGGSTTLDAGSGYSLYNWSTGATTQTINVNTATTVIVTVTDGNGCTGSNSKTTTVNANPTPSIIGSTSFCSGGSTTLDAGSGYSLYNWSTGATTQTINVNTATTVTVTVTDGNGCTGSNSKTTTINTSPTAALTGIQNICSGSNATVSLDFTGSAPWNYTISDGSQIISGSTSNDPETVTIPNPSVGSHTYTVTTLSDFNCSGSGTGSASVVVNTGALSASVVIPPINNLPVFACNGSVVNNINVPAVGNATQYIWDGPPGTTFNGSNPYTSNSPTANITFGMLAGSSSGYYIGVQAANACGSSVRKVQWVRGTISVPTVSGPLVICGGGSGVYTITNVPALVGAQSYTWTGPAGSTIDGNPSPYTTASTSVTLTVPAGFTTGTLCVKANAGCISTINKCISISKNPAPLGVLSGVFTVCSPATEVYTVSNPGVVGGTYNWSIPANTSGTSNTNSISLSILSGFAGGNLSVTYTNACGVTSGIRLKSIANGSAKVPSTLTANATNGLCAQLATFQCTAQAGATFNWTFPTGSNPASITAGTNSAGATMPGAPFTTGQVCVSATNACGTSNPRCITVKGTPATPGVTIPIPASWCAPASGIQFNGNIASLGGAYSLTWAVIPASKATYVSGQGTNTYTVDWNASGTASVNLTASNACGSTTRPLAVNVSNCLRLADGAVAIPAAGYALTVSPNPAASVINFEFVASASSVSEVSLMDMSGRTVITTVVNATEGVNSGRINASHLAKGIYTLQLKSIDGTSFVKVNLQ